MERMDSTDEAGDITRQVIDTPATDDDLDLMYVGGNCIICNDKENVFVMCMVQQLYYMHVQKSICYMYCATDVYVC